MNKFNIIDFNNELKDMNEEIVTSIDNLNKIIAEENEIENDFNNLLKRVEHLAKKVDWN